MWDVKEENQSWHTDSELQRDGLSWEVWNCTCA